MANNVNSCLQVVKISAKGQEVWNSYVQDVLCEDSNLAYYIANNLEAVKFNDMCEEIGAKWAFATDFDDEMVVVESAWSPVAPWADKVAKAIGKVDPDVKLKLTYEDEMPNYIGVATFGAEGFIANNELDWEEIKEMVIKGNSELEAMYDEEECDWHPDKEDEAEELLHECLWEETNCWQEDNVIWEEE